MVVSGGTTLLALAGVVTAAVLIFTASLAVLWPMLIGCACAAAVGAIIFMVVRCACLKNGGENTEKDGKPFDASLQKNASSQSSNTETELAPELAQVQPQATQDTTTKFAYALDVMKDDVTISDALATLAANNGVQLSENDRGEICRLVHNIGANTLGDLRQERSACFYLIDIYYNISNDALPFLFPILALFPDSEFYLDRNKDGGLCVGVAFHEIIPFYYHQFSTYSVFNHSNSEYFKSSFLYDESKNIANKYIFAVHYAEENKERRLVVDYSWQATDVPIPQTIPGGEEDEENLEGREDANDSSPTQTRVYVDDY
jgi:hypothetical protein